MCKFWLTRNADFAEFSVAFSHATVKPLRARTSELDADTKWLHGKAATANSYPPLCDRSTPRRGLSGRSFFSAALARRLTSHSSGRGQRCALSVPFAVAPAPLNSNS